MLVRFDNAAIEGIFSIDGYIDASGYSAKQLADLILARVQQAGTTH